MYMAGLANAQPDSYSWQPLFVVVRFVCCSFTLSRCHIPNTSNAKFMIANATSKMCLNGLTFVLMS